MDQRRVPWKSEWKAAGLDPGPLSEEEAALVPGLEEANRAFLERHPPGVALRRRAREFRLSTWVLPLAAAAALLLLALPLGQVSEIGRAHV